MSAISSTPGKHSQIDRHCLRGEFQQALDTIALMLRDDPLDRTTQFYELLVRIVANGPEGCEAEIENLRSHSDLNDQEKNLVRKILVVCYDAAERQRDLGRMWSYQRLLRRLVSNQSMDAPIPRDDYPAAQHSFAAPLTAFRDVGDRFSLLWTASASEARKRLFGYIESLVGGRPGPLVLVLAIVTALLAIYAVRGSFWQNPSSEKARPLAAPAFLSSAAINDVEVTLSELSAKVQRVDLDAVHQDKLRAFCQGKLNTLKALYALRTQEVSGLTGNMTVELVIDGYGNVTRIFESAASLIDIGFKKTVLDEMHKWQFPALNQGQVSMTVVYDFSAKPVPPLLSAPAKPTFQTGQQISPVVK